MKWGKAAGQSGIVVEMSKTAGDAGANAILLLRLSIMARSQMTEQSFIVSLYKGKGDALDRGNYQGLKLTEQ